MCGLMVSSRHTGHSPATFHRQTSICQLPCTSVISCCSLVSSTKPICHPRVRVDAWLPHWWHKTQLNYRPPQPCPVANRQQQNHRSQRMTTMFICVNRKSSKWQNTPIIQGIFNCFFFNYYYYYYLEKVLI